MSARQVRPGVVIDEAGELQIDHAEILLAAGHLPTQHYRTAFRTLVRAITELVPGTNKRGELEKRGVRSELMLLAADVIDDAVAGVDAWAEEQAIIDRAAARGERS